MWWPCRTTPTLVSGSWHGLPVLGVRGISQITHLSLGLAFKLLVPVTHPSPDALGSSWTKYLNSVPAFSALWAIFSLFSFLHI